MEILIPAKQEERPGRNIGGGATAKSVDVIGKPPYMQGCTWEILVPNVRREKRIGMWMILRKCKGY